MAADAQEIRRNWEQQRADQATWRNQWQVLADYFMPERSNVTIQREPGANQTAHIFDSTAIRAPERLAASLHGALTSPVQKWFSLTLRQEELNDIDGVAAWNEENADRMYAAYRQSNFTQAMGQVYRESPVFGTAAILQEERPRGMGGVFGGLRFTSLAIGTYTMDEGAEGTIDSLYRRLQMSVRAAHDRWGEKIGRDAMVMLKEHPGRMLSVLHAVYPRGKRSRRSDDSRNYPFASCYVMEEMGRDGDVLEEGGFREFPYAIFRWDVGAGEVYGRGPGHTSKPDALTLNRLKELDLQALSREVDPVMEILEDSIVGEGLSLNPGAINWVTTSGAIQVVESKRRHDIVMRELGDIRNAIDECFYASQLILAGKSNMTAEEVRTRIELMQRLLGPTVGRFQAEGLSKVIERTFSIMARRSALRPAPMELLEAAPDGDLDITYEGPLARAMRAHDLMAIDRKNQWVVANYPLHPEVIDLYDVDREFREMAEITGYPADLVRDQKDVERLRKERAAAMQKQAELQLAAGAAEAIGKAGPGVKALAEAGQGAAAA